MSILVGRKYRGVHNTSMVVKVIALGQREVMVKCVEDKGSTTHFKDEEFLVRLSGFHAEWKLLPEERVINVRIWPDGCMSSGNAVSKNNLRLTLADGVLIEAEVIKCS